MVPLGIVAGALNWSSTAVFTINFFAIIPLAAVLSFATEEISVKLGETMGGLLNATFGNAVELIVSQYHRWGVVGTGQCTNSYRSVSSLSRMVRSKLCSPLCLDQSCPTCCLSWECVSSLVDGLIVVKTVLVVSKSFLPLWPRPRAPS